MAMTERIKALKEDYLGEKPRVSIERARIWTDSHKETEGENIAIRRAKAFAATCEKLPVIIFENELVVGSIGESKKCGVLTPEYSWIWVDQEMDHFENRPQDPYYITDEQKRIFREELIPYWKGQSLEEVFLARLPKETADYVVDTSILEMDSKWRQAVGEATPDYQDQLFPLGFKGMRDKAKNAIAALDLASAEGVEKKIFYESLVITCEGMIAFARRYAAEARRLADQEKNPARQRELCEIAASCDRVPENPPRTFREGVQFIWFTQVGGILSENPLALNLGRFDQYMYPYYKADLESGRITREQALEIIEALWLKMSTWFWTIGSNTADFFAGYNQFQNCTVGGKTRDGFDGTNDLTYMCMQATDETLCHQPGLAVRVAADCPEEFMAAVTSMLSKGGGFPAVHNDESGYQMLIHAGLSPDDAREWSNCGCVLAHTRQVGEWTSTVNVNFTSALEFALNRGKTRLTGMKLGVTDKDITEYESYEEIEAAFYKEMENLIRHAAIASVIAQEIHTEVVPRPYFSLLIGGCLDNGKDLSKAGAKYPLGPAQFGIGMAVVANSLAVIRKLVFEEKSVTLKELGDAMEADWQGYDELRRKVLAVPKYGNDDDYVDHLAVEITNYFHRETVKYTDYFGKPFRTIFAGITNYMPCGRVVGATPEGRRAKEPSVEGISPFIGTDTSTPLAAMRSAAKIVTTVHMGQLLNLRVSEDQIKTKRGQKNLGDAIQAYFALGGFQVQFNCVSTETLLEAQREPEKYRDLLVRVAGYSTQFVALSPSMQKAIIERTEHSSIQ